MLMPSPSGVQVSQLDRNQLSLFVSAPEPHLWKWRKLVVSIRRNLGLNLSQALMDYQHTDEFGSSHPTPDKESKRLNKQSS